MDEDLKQLDVIDEPVVNPRAQDRLLELIEREQLPEDVRQTLAGALTGDLRRQQLLFQAMLDTWPRLQKNISEVLRDVKRAPWSFSPFSKRGEEPEESATDKAGFVEDAFHGMKPDRSRGELGGPGIIEALAYGYFSGHQIVEVRWDRNPKGILPKAGKVVPSRFYGYPYDGTLEDEEDRLMLNPDGGLSGWNYTDFPKHKFLLGINGGHPGHPTVAAPLRALTGYWLAATFGLKWLLNFAQLYGIPFRWAEYADINDKSKVCDMLKNIGSAGWGAFPAGTKINFEDAGKAANQLPQRELIALADTQCDTFILGQTLTTDVSTSGSRALGEVHEGVKSGVISGVAQFVADVLNEQLFPSIIELNYGETEEVPCIGAKFEKPKDEKGMAERDLILFQQLGLPVEKSWLYERHGVPLPDADSKELFQPGANGAQGEPATGSDSPHETRARLNTSEVKANIAKPSPIDRLSQTVLEDLTGVSSEWLSPVRPFFDRLAALALSEKVDDDDFVKALASAQGELPELFDKLGTEQLEESLKQAIGTAMLDGSVSRYEEDGK